MQILRMSQHHYLSFNRSISLSFSFIYLSFRLCVTDHFNFDRRSSCRTTSVKLFPICVCVCVLFFFVFLRFFFLFQFTFYIFAPPNVKHTIVKSLMCHIDRIVNQKSRNLFTYSIYGHSKVIIILLDVYHIKLYNR